MRQLSTFLFWAVRFRWLLLTRQQKDAEILFLRQQLAMVLRHSKRLPLGDRERAFFAAVPLDWPGWRSALAVIKPDTLLRWHRAGFRAFWRWKSRGSGRPRKDAEVRALIRRLAHDNPLWGAPRVHGELLKLGFAVSQATVSRYMPRRPRPWARPGWRAFIANHLSQTVAVDFLVVPTVTFRLLYAFVVLSHDRRRVIHVNVTAEPSAEWTIHQIREAFPFDSAPRFLLRDRDGIYGDYFKRAVQRMGIEQVLTAPRSPWQNGICERALGTLRRELLDHVIVLNEAGALDLLRRYQRYYNEARTHTYLNKDSPDGREVQGPDRGARIVAIPHIGGLHHHYERLAA